MRLGERCTRVRKFLDLKIVWSSSSPARQRLALDTAGKSVAAD